MSDKQLAVFVDMVRQKLEVAYDYSTDSLCDKYEIPPATGLMGNKYNRVEELSEIRDVMKYLGDIRDSLRGGDND